MTQLRDAAGDAPFIFVVGKGGVGKTTTAGALALELADDSVATHLISTDPAHSLADLFGQILTGGRAQSDCSVHLDIEEFDAVACADRWLRRSLPGVTQIVEHGTYLDGADVAAFSRLALPGVDELMAVIRLTDLAARDRRVVVDTAPTGHTLRLLDAAATLGGIARALRAMADKADAVAASLTGRPVRLTGEVVIDELQQYVEKFRSLVLGPAAFVVVDRPGRVVAAETRRVIAALHQRGLRVAATVTADLDSMNADSTVPAQTQAANGPGVRLSVPRLDAGAGCDRLRAWRASLRPYASDPAPVPAPRAGGVQDREPAEPDGVQDREPAGPAGAPSDTAAAPVPVNAPALPWLERTAPRMLLVAGKGGVGKSTCAAALALALADTRDVLLCSADPAGSIDDVLDNADGGAQLPPRLRTLQIRPDAELARLRERWHADVHGASAALDRRVIDELWELVPPGIDEMAAIAAMQNAAGSAETVVLDAAPTGHFLRLLDTPALALDWTRQLMRIVVKYGLSGAGDNIATSLISLSRELRALQETLHDETETAVLVVTLDEPMVIAETGRLSAALERAGVHVAGVIVNRQTDRQATAAGGSIAAVTIAAPLVAAPIGEHALREFVAAWNIVA